MSISKPLQMSLDDLKAWLSSNEQFTPPIGHTQFKKITLMMAVSLMVKSMDDSPRRMRQELSNYLFDLREALGVFNPEEIEVSLKKFLTEVIKENIKTCPVSLSTVKVLLYAMADNNMIKPPKGEDITSKILNTRAVLYSLSKDVSEQMITQDQILRQTEMNQVETSSEKPQQEKPESI